MIKAYIVCSLSYTIALLVVILVGILLVNYLHPLLMILIADFIATIIIFILGTVLKNSSLYDPYWSVAPLIIALYFIIFPQSATVNFFRQLVVLILVFAWSVRLTFNWIRQWRGLRHEDWRYSQYRMDYGRNFWFINLTGIHLMPTILVYLGCLSLYPALSLSSKPIMVLDFAAIIITVSAILIEGLADNQLSKFVKTRKNSQELLNTGLWSVSRHPNYLGEILFWWGMYAFALATDLSFYWAIIGPIGMTLLFNIVSIPLIEKRHLKRKPEYPEYKRKVSRLIPWFPKK